MKNGTITLCTAVLLILSACSHPSNLNEIRNVTKLQVNNPVQESHIEGDTLYYDALYPTDICVIDTFMLIAQHKDKHLIHVYGLQGGSLLGKFLQQGGAPNEVNMWNGFTQYWKEKGEIKMLIQSYPQYAAILNMNRSLVEGKAVFEKRFSFNKDSAAYFMQRSNVAYLVDNKFLMTRAPERVKGLKDYTPSLQWFDFEKDQPGNIVYTMDLEMIANPFLYISGGLSLRPSGDKLCYACRFLNTFTILNLSDETALQIYTNNEDLDIQAIANAEKNSVYYSDVTSTDDYLFLTTSRGVDYDKVAGTTIEVYDWEGKHIHRFLFADILHYITIDETGRNLYAVLQDGGMKRYSLVY